MPYCLRLLPLWPNQVPHVVSLIFLRNRFLYYIEFCLSIYLFFLVFFFFFFCIYIHEYFSRVYELFIVVPHKTGFDNVVFIVGVQRKRSSGTCLGSCPAGLCCVIGSLGAMWARWPWWTLTKYNAIPARMPRRSSAMLFLSMILRPPEDGLVEARGYSATNLSLIIDTPSCTNAKRLSLKAR